MKKREVTINGLRLSRELIEQAHTELDAPLWIPGIGEYFYVSDAGDEARGLSWMRVSTSKVNLSEWANHKLLGVNAQGFLRAFELGCDFTPSVPIERDRC